MSTSTWSDLMHACHRCQRCALCDRPTTTFFGVGAHDAQVLIIGDCGQSLIGGHNGTQLAQLMELIGLSRNNTYITAVVKCKTTNFARRCTRNTRRACHFCANRWHS